MTESIGWMLAAACLATGLTCLALAVARVGDRGAQLTHATTGVAMAGMFSPWGDPVPGWLGAVGFTVLGSWFVAAALRREAGRTAHHLAISSAAMVLMYLMHHHSAPTTGAPAGAHAGHLAGSGGTTSLFVLPLALVLAGYFAWHTWTCVERSRTPDAAASPSVRTAVRPPARIEPVAHAAMSALMAAMFLVMV